MKFVSFSRNAAEQVVTISDICNRDCSRFAAGAGAAGAAVGLFNCEDYLLV
jgi:hypothetical protein